MQITINDTVYDVPFDPAVITLEDFVLYQKEYGRDLDKKLKDLLDKKYTGDEDEIEINRSSDLEEHLDTEALCWYSFWTKFDLIEVRDHPSVTPLLQQYRVLRHLLTDDKDLPHEFPVELEWNDEPWYISDFKINPASDMSFNEIITSKEVMRQVYAIGAGRWAGLPYLCAVYLRKKDEVFSDALVQEGGERMKLFKTLPLIHALSVAFFLNVCVNIWSRALASSAEMEEETISRSLEPSTTNGDGLIFSAPWLKLKSLIFRVPAWIASNALRRRRRIKY